MKAIACAILLGLISTAAFAAGTPAENVMPGDQGSQPPGGLSDADVTGKWLLNANGVEVGRIQGVTPNGRAAMVKTDAGQLTTVSMSRLSLGNGPNTVIESGDSEADQLNRIQMGSGGR